jgi:ribosomal protein S27E
MNLVTLECPLCRGMIQVDASAAGQQVACPLCQGTMQVPPADVLAAAFAPPGPPSSPPPGFAGGMPPVPVALMPLACPTCGGMFQVPPSAAGMELPCPACGQLVTIPDPAALAAAAPLPGGADDDRDRPQAHWSAAPAAAGPQVISAATDVASLLPPGAAEAEAAGETAAPGTAWDVKALLPPGAAEAGAPGEQVALPQAPRPILVSHTAAGSILFPTPEGHVMALEEKPKVIGQGENEVEVRRLTPAEKARRKLVRNVILFVVGVAGLLAIVIYMSR